MNRKLRRRLRHIERRLAALEHAGEPIDVSGEPLDPQRIARHVSGDYATYIDDGDEWNPTRGYL